jgi:hypothetical protein
MRREFNISNDAQFFSVQLFLLKRSDKRSITEQREVVNFPKVIK